MKSTGKAKKGNRVTSYVVRRRRAATEKVTTMQGGFTRLRRMKLPCKSCGLLFRNKHMIWCIECWIGMCLPCKESLEVVNRFRDIDNPLICEHVK